MKANTNNNVLLTGNLGKDPEIKIAANGRKQAKFPLATHRKYNNAAGEKTDETEWHYVSAWGKLAERIEAEFKKGSFVSVEGRLKTRNYKDADGQKRYITEVIASGVTPKVRKEETTA